MAVDQATFDAALTDFFTDVDAGLQAIQDKLASAGDAGGSDRRARAGSGREGEVRRRGSGRHRLVAEVDVTARVWDGASGVAAAAGSGGGRGTGVVCPVPGADLAGGAVGSRP
jgi:hypothetical protein